MSTDFSGFGLPQVGGDPMVVTFPGPDIPSFGGELPGLETSASDNSSEGIFGTVEFDSSWIGDGMDWVSLHRVWEPLMTPLSTHKNFDG